ncbi:TonB-dependent receptor domain-containing protein [Janthinobacterium aquaticum]|uniref:TonB-dependent receptor domain-containing protein n=1 Tax=Janthinobacterium sp. FT58W TaxID=2654254 RepID=UPI0012642433|nr:TonB-dependent receptor [Janthinobacterium sp. FT58W]KAB8043389.1 TonB-dependent receptor plug domain-containing protein [Janthinobacterium sp. FT58W]
MKFDVTGARFRTLMGLGNLAMGMSLCSITYAQDQVTAAGPHADAGAGAAGIPQILVRGKNTLDMDIHRNRDDIQPYVVFDAEQISRSGAQTIEGFLQTYLPMNAQQNTSSQLGPQTQPSGRLDLRGLGANQTLILLDGRRLPSISTGDSFQQASLNGISLSQIERIEILPATASGIYGGGATGGVINIILKREYSGIEGDVSYGNATDGAVGEYRVGLTGGFTLEDGRTRVLFSATHADAGVLQSNRRSFNSRGRQLQMRNDPTDTSVLMGGANICSTVDGFTCSTDPLQLKSGASLGSALTSVPAGYTGAASDGGAALAANAGKLQFNNTALPLWSAPETSTFAFNPRREFTKNIEGYLDFAHDQSKTSQTMPTQSLQYVPASASVNPFQQDVLSYLTVPNGLVQQQVVKNSRAHLGAIMRLPAHWSAVAEYGWLRNTTSSTNSTALGAASEAADETLQGAVLRDIVASPLSNPNSLFSFYNQRGEMSNTLKTLSLRLSGPLMKLPGGDLTATASLEQRRETSDNAINFSDIGGESRYTWTPAAHRKVDAQYLELRAPITSPGTKVPYMHALELMASVRHDAYRTDFSGSQIPVDSANGPFLPQTASVNSFGSTNNTLGFRYAPTRDIALRASRGTGFLPPDLGQIRSAAPAQYTAFLISLLGLRDPARGNTPIPAPLTVLAGGNASLEPEASRSTSLGVVITPRFAPGLRISLDHTDIHKTNEVSALPLSYIIANEAAFPGRVVRGPSSGGQPGPITQIDASSFNLASTRLKAVDLQAEYKTSSETFGHVRFHAAGTYTQELSRSVLANDAAVDRAGYSDGPLKWRGNFGIDWSPNDSWSAGWNAQYYHSYRICQSTLSALECQSWEKWQGASKVQSQLYHDVHVSYDFGTKQGMLSNTQASFAVNNVFNDQGSAIASGVAYVVGPTSYTDPRGRRFSLSLRKHF